MLSDVCADFLVSFSDLAKALAEDAHHYSSPDNLIRYGEEIDALRRVCLKVADNPLDVTAGAELLRLAASIRHYHDTPPDQPDLGVREAEMMALVKILRDGAPDETSFTKKMVEHLQKDGEPGKKAAEQTRGILERLSTPAYDAAVKIIGDVGSATVRRLLGL